MKGIWKVQRWKLDPLAAVTLVVLLVGLSVFSYVNLWMKDPGGGSDHAAAGQSAGVLVEDTAEDLAQAISGSEIAKTPVGEDAVVYVSGAVSTPGVVHLPLGSRVCDALEAAGGALPEADVARINLARKVMDGEQIHVTVQGEVDVGTGEETSRETTNTTCVDINSADMEQLQQLDGVGPALAQRILDHREEFGPFSSPESLVEVTGIGTKKLRAIRDSLCP
ncbi:ComEA family DNA-binding protein [Actinomycetaceae bacterium WB03_NA08]|uniref:ComEA family DNA-binding protein n=1 Tax=Scrofimicrobium canadense TaxID=2652290 RepID=A0A6N7VS01_9ACTO|nr:ComEA family DNA-binding protein [Scrofimicrobium canadense]MSS84559.1 ComEA family DNA-binding protein [Scrofimicrobium canadense]